ncbi:MULTISPECIES: GNAT family N-acetyltransferase [unclassified Fusibacter]|uniref:GNAT family N-acetyltransferase n=1 Tax=unclassified Fusibacter TaxID=2624464 RepID=UPI001011F258|nr:MULTISPECIES: GNAT family N-acetyltransferase [unclassified Fusibacter]MCK8059567.1 GNAT family N-acetyltransferase [Fusibacter sp. A2]NPE21368.1 GNAT family N-acetyltransferase [Fusibacter sp. A1]RXV61784.1 N-acetyltransferase [Fusibacter sp. A1]
MLQVRTGSENIDKDLAVKWLKETYWANDRKTSDIIKSMEEAFCLSLYENGRMVGFLRLITDYVFYGYLCDVIIDPERRGEGIGKLLISSLLEQTFIHDLFRIKLKTEDAQGFYEPFGFKRITDEHKYMEWKNPNFNKEMMMSI